MFKDLKSKQSFTIAAITFWGQFATYSLISILILYLTKSTAHYGLGFSEHQAYSFQGVSQAMGYAILMIGGYIADRYLGLRRAILLGSLLMAFSYLLIFISGFFVQYTNEFFIFSYALIPASSSLFLGTSSGMVSKIYSTDFKAAKGAMTSFYIAINLGSLIAFTVSPILIGYKYGALAILAIVFVGKTIAALNFYYRFEMYDNVVDKIDKESMPYKSKLIVVSYLVVAYVLTLIFYQIPNQANVILGTISIICLLAFLLRTVTGLKAEVRIKQIIGLFLIVIAVVFFVVYNQMGSTLILLAKNNSDLNLLGLTVKPASYNLINPIIIIFGGMALIKIYPLIPRFYIPYQFAVGVLLSAISLLVLYYAFLNTSIGIINGNYIGLTFVLLSIAELFVSAVGLSMIGIYCDSKTMGFAMGAWYIACSLSNSITGLVNQVVALPKDGVSTLASATIYQNYFLNMGATVLVIGIFICFVTFAMIKYMKARNIDFV
ncbi:MULTISPECIES: peptide MFS transporter [unclassified Francisella]|uniref:peptide MFS transporter n=1 Tax=unclassified Francisella TaxID=2610885 RepID=UPI002E37057C|nr:MULTISPECIES: oligopeptide:H+ symporter [unclassified Francisella]MED7818987.1 oligopeptide:H+ symporter [Francisella sp. 19S2-4]MED7829856.1 oligopeptide:H+ symporter [Francisella sp. 19S2-10]